jgi:serine/threonine protein kinase
VSPKEASITMTVLAAPPTIVATAPCPAEPAAPATRRRWQRFATFGNIASSRRRLVVDPDRNAVASAAPGSPDPNSIVDTWPLRGSDPGRVDGYRLVSRLGAGGMADVFYGVAPTGQPVAVKILRAASGGPEACRREYRLASAVGAGCTAPVIGHGVAPVGAYLVTAYLPGYRCGTTLLGRPTPAGRLWSFGAALARVLAAIHAKGIVHCDVKPSNLLVRGLVVRVIDFGIARYVGERCGYDGMVQCSRGWAAPEQLRTEAATPAVDVFAWGCVLAHLASGVHPFASQSATEWILRVQSTEPDLSGLPADLDEVIRATLARDPRDRPSAGELAMICRAR